MMPEYSHVTEFRDPPGWRPRSTSTVPWPSANSVPWVLVSSGTLPGPTRQRQQAHIFGQDDMAARQCARLSALIAPSGGLLPAAHRCLMPPATHNGQP